jgi:hypothetical protein
MYLQKVISKNLREKIFFVGVLKVTDEKSRVRTGSGSGSVSQRYGTADPHTVRTKLSQIQNAGFFTFWFILTKKTSLLFLTKQSFKRVG